MASTRQQRIEQLLVEEVSDIIRRDVKDPRIGFITITGAEVSPDLRHARVFLSILGSAEQQSEGLKGLRSASRFIRREFGKRVGLRVTPEIDFRFDAAIAHGARIFELLEQVHREESAASEPDVAETASGRPSGEDASREESADVHP